MQHLLGAGVGVLSEESGRHRPDRPCTVVVDPLDGSTNASRGVSWYATSLCAVEEGGARAALVADLVHGVRYTALRGRGAWLDGAPIGPSGCTTPGEAIVAVNGLPSHHFGWAQYRALGAAALDLCAVADGRVDAYLDLTSDGLGPWDYLGALLVCREAGAVIDDVSHRDLVVLDHDARRSPWATATPALTESLRAAAGADGGGPRTGVVPP